MANDSDTLTLAQALVKDVNNSEENNFKVRIDRKVGNTYQTIATLEGATIANLASPETWVPSLVGGGELSLRVYHAGNIGTPLGGGIRLNIANVEPHEPDPAALRRSSWTGPSVITFPKLEDRKGDVPPQSVVLPPGPYNQHGAATPSGHASGGAVVNGDAHFLNYLLEQERARNAQLNDAFGRQQALIAAQTKATEDLRAQMVEDRRASDEKLAKMERAATLEALEARHREEMAKLEARLQAAQPAAQPPPPPPAMAWDKFAVALTPLVSELLKNNHETRLKMMELDAKRAEQLQVTLANMSAAKGVDPVVKELMDTVKSMMEKTQTMMENARNREDPTASFLPQMTAAFSSVMDITTNAMRASVEASTSGQPPAESPWIRAIGEIGKALADVMKGVEIKVGNQGAAPQLPAGEAYANAARANAPPPPVQPPQLPQAPAQPRSATPMDNIDAMVKAKTDPDSIAANFVRLLTSDDESVNKVVSEVDGDFNRLVQRWKSVDQHFIHDKLMPALNREGEKAGIFKGNDEGGSGGGNGNDGGTPPPAAPAAPPTP